jgi:S-adenosylmethionine:tRNA ribosyltransferase-isomerase
MISSTEGTPLPVPSTIEQEIFLDYNLPRTLIAQEPCAQRDQSRLMVVWRSSGLIEHRVFFDLPNLLQAGDLLILNDTRVLPARLRGRTTRTGGKWEGLFLQVDESGVWKILSRTRSRLQPGDAIAIEPGPLNLILIARKSDGHWLVRTEPEGSPEQILAVHGLPPLPLYIRRGHSHGGDTERYQTVYASRPGAVAAPTAGLHFSSQLFEHLQARGIEHAFVTLHVGPGTFQPIKARDFRQHCMHSERGELSAATAAAIERVRKRKGRVVAVGTTSVRVLETAFKGGRVQPWSGDAGLFIFPPYRFQAVDALITNFHLPRSTLLLLVDAFGGSHLIRQAYAEAIQAGYRFYSYGDAMLVV